MNARAARPRTLRHPHRDALGVHVLRRQNSDGPGESPLTEAMPKLSARPISGIGQNAAEAQSGLTNPIDLVERDAPFRSIDDPLGHLRSLSSRRVVAPRLRSIETQSDRRRQIVSRESE